MNFIEDNVQDAFQFSIAEEDIVEGIPEDNAEVDIVVLDNPLGNDCYYYLYILVYFAECYSKDFFQ